MSTSTALHAAPLEFAPALQPERSGAEIVLDVLQEQGVQYVFGHTGGAIIPIHTEWNARMRQGQPTPHFILCRQESGAGHAAEGFARVSGKVGVALATSGPGSTNLVTPIADAYKDSVPCVFITGQVPKTMIGNDAFQEVDMVGITRPISKHNFLVREVEELDSVLRQAFYIARSGRPGPVVVDVCKNALLARTRQHHQPQSERLRARYHPDVQLDEAAADALLKALLAAKRPIIKAGGGVINSGASQALRAFVDKYQLPLTLTFMALGAVNHDHPLFLGMPGMHGTVAANMALRDADFILAIGSRFDDRVAVRNFGHGATVAHVDIDRAELGKNVTTPYQVHANLKDFLEYAVQADFTASPHQAEWLAEVSSLRQKHCPPPYNNDGHPVKPQYLIEELSRLSCHNSTVVTGVGQHQMWAALYYNYQRPYQWVSSGGLGTMGFGLPAAIGAYYANPAHPVICIDGDGSFQMNIQELGTVVANQVPLKIFVLNNGFLGMVRQWEDMFNSGYHYETCLARTTACDPACMEAKECRTPIPNFLNLEKVYPGLRTRRIIKPEDVRPTLEEVLSDNDPWVVDVWIDRTENVKPMIPPGGTLDDILYD